MSVLWLLMLFAFTQGDIVVKSLQDTTIYAENLGTTKLYHYTWKLVIGIETSGIDPRLKQIQESYEKANGLCMGCNTSISKSPV